MLRIISYAGLGAAALALSAPAQAQGPAGRQAAASPHMDCAGLAGLAKPALGEQMVVITAASLQPASAPRPAGPQDPPTPALPEHCELFGKLQERQGANGQTYAIKFHMRLPTAWNGGFFFQGGGGTNGVVGSALGALLGAQPDNGLIRGYAVISQDSGHDNAVNNDPKLQGVATFGWDAQARRNYGFASIGPVTAVGKALVRAYYGRSARRSYFVGGSKGGEEAMMAAERYPDQYDGILAGYPGYRLAYAGAVGQIFDAQAFAEVARRAGQVDASGLPLINKAFSDEDLALVSAAVLKACDGLDGTTDGMVENFLACTTPVVAPALDQVRCAGAKTPACLSGDQIAALTKVIGGARDGSGRLLYSNWAWDSGFGGRTLTGYQQGWRAWKLGRYGSDHNDGLAIALGGASASAVFTSPPTPVADDPAALTRYALAADVEENARKVRAKWGGFDESAADFMVADATDLSRFTRHGGKMVMFHGVSDPVFSILDTIAWWNRVDARSGGHAADFVRLFAVPGMNHGGGGPATDQIDAFSALVAWTEQGVAPSQLIATAREATPWPGRTRLLCPYPQQPRRVGADIESAASFRCQRP